MHPLLRREGEATCPGREPVEVCAVVEGELRGVDEAEAFQVEGRIRVDRRVDVGEGGAALSLVARPLTILAIVNDASKAYDTVHLHCNCNCKGRGHALLSASFLLQVSCFSFE